MDKILTVIGLAAFLLTASCQPRPASNDVINHIKPIDQNDVKYHYQYGINDPDSGVMTHKWEERLGNYVKGAYSLMEPDGKIRTVDYEVDGPKGFHAVIRTSLPGNSYMSIRQLHKSRLDHRHPPVNILTNNPITEPVLEARTPRLIHKDLPPNFHSLKPDYFWGSLPHDHFNQNQPQSSHNTPVTTHSPTYRNRGSNELNKLPQDGNDHSARFGKRLRQPIPLATPVKQSTRRSPLKRLMVPPRRDAPIMNYDHLLRPGTITFASYGTL